MSKNCDMIKDLLPLYADDVCSEESRKAVEEHINSCPDCKAELELSQTQPSYKYQTPLSKIF